VTDYSDDVLVHAGIRILRVSNPGIDPVEETGQWTDILKRFQLLAKKYRLTAENAKDMCYQIEFEQQQVATSSSAAAASPGERRSIMTKSKANAVLAACAAAPSPPKVELKRAKLEDAKGEVETEAAGEPAKKKKKKLTLVAKSKVKAREYITERLEKRDPELLQLDENTLPTGEFKVDIEPLLFSNECLNELFFGRKKKLLATTEANHTRRLR
jgi:hypothetical protein